MAGKIRKYIPLFVLSIAVVAIIVGGGNWENLQGLIPEYPTITTEEIPGGDSNRLHVQGFLHDHKINVDGEPDYERSEDIGIPVGHNVSLDYNPEGIDAGGTTDYTIQSDENLENIVLEALPNYGGGEFAGWSGCDSDTGTTCQISVTDNQKRKVEVHYVDPEPGPDPLQLFSVSNNPLGGTLSDEWVNANPELAYKAAYTEISGSIPDTINQLNADLQLSLGGNELSGSIPEETGQLGDIDYLGLQKNDLSGSIPSEIGGLTPIYFLAYMNNLSGEIPPEMGEFTSRVERLELHDNELSGTVPADLANIQDLTPSELRLYNNQLSAAEDELISDSSIDGFNFHNNLFNESSANEVLLDAANRSGEYIDFCGNPLWGGEVNYGLDGEPYSVDMLDGVNAAAEEGWDVYIPINLMQDYEVYGPYRGYEACDGNPSCVQDTTCVEEDEDGDCIEEKDICENESTCEIPTYPGEDTPPTGNVDCARIYGAIESPDDIEDNSEGIPNELQDVYYYNDCEWYTGPSSSGCRPECDFDRGTCPSEPPCGSPDGFKCEYDGEEDVDYGPNTGDADEDPTGTCPGVKQTY